MKKPKYRQEDESKATQKETEERYALKRKAYVEMPKFRFDDKKMNSGKFTVVISGKNINGTFAVREDGQITVDTGSTAIPGNIEADIKREVMKGRKNGALMWEPEIQDWQQYQIRKK